ncbi:DUF418 domain-containing protein [Cohnella faecalis]|uniref:DUF418 domain-containing protein n=1 Tax=Cohnella faecalis TaxID=2315694 RepID=A0A398CEN7_9BACL|nr:DUF418 domain-containing protein [Cohnella faecalis]RIE01090.1 DUF418 domain-containing protein [Cohnella faecalis]
MTSIDEQGNRVGAVDKIRGLCLLGILMANMVIFQYGFYGMEAGSAFHLSRIDEWAHRGLQIVVDGNFIPIFMFLFGYGVYKLRRGLVQRGLKPGWVLVRRFVMLIVFGIAHSFALWEGDILMGYGTMGFALLLFANRKPKTLIIWTLLLSLVLIAAGYGTGDSKSEKEEKQRIEEYVERSIEVYQHGSYAEIFDFRLSDDPDIPDLPGNGAVLAAVVIIAMLPMFLLGIIAAGKRWFHDPGRERRRYIGSASVLLPIGLGLKSWAVLHLSSAWSGVWLTAGAGMLALGYIALAALLFSIVPDRNVVARAFQAVGKMSLTNYLMQSVICTTLFYGYGFGWFGKLGVLSGVLLAAGIYSVQAAASLLLLSRFKIGPMERVLRMVTYWSLSGRPRTRKVPVPDPIGANVG